jgi:DNA-binding transcriptional regulator LsrR (DeoR family)
MAELAVAYFTGEVNARQVAEVLKISATNVKTHLGTALIYAVRSGKISITLTR